MTENRKTCTTQSTSKRLFYGGSVCQYSSEFHCLKPQARFTKDQLLLIAIKVSFL